MKPSPSPRVKKKMPPNTTAAPTAPAMMRLRETFDRSAVFLGRCGLEVAASLRGVLPSVAKTRTRLPGRLSMSRIRTLRLRGGGPYRLRGTMRVLRRRAGKTGRHGYDHDRHRPAGAATSA